MFTINRSNDCTNVEPTGTLTTELDFLFSPVERSEGPNPVFQGSTSPDPTRHVSYVSGSGEGCGDSVGLKVNSVGLIPPESWRRESLRLSHRRRELTGPVPDVYVVGGP